MRIGILGGTFNPIHIAHIKLAEVAKEKLKLDKVIFIPTYTPPHKKYSDIIDPYLRYEMVRLAIQDKKDFEVSDIEINKKGISYSVETLKLLKEKYTPDADLFFITGSDSLEELLTWKDIDEIFTLAHFVIATRSHFPLKHIPKEARILEMPEIDISSTEIRKKIKKRESINGIVPKQVISYIEKKKLYRG